MSSVLIVGAGAWGTALALQAHRAGCRTTLCRRRPWEGRVSPRLPGYPLPEGIVLGEAPVAADLVVLAVPIQHLRAAAGALRGGALMGGPLMGGAVVAVAKGVEAGTGLLTLEVLAQVRPGPAAVLTGPNFAGEIAAGLPAAAVVAGVDAGLRAHVIRLLATPGFRLYGNDDPIGAQLGGAAKNVIAIAAGAVIGAGLGENARAALVTRGVAELARLATALGGRAETAAGLSGLGDLLLTCTGAASRNFRLGLGLGRGEPLAVALEGISGVVEGVATAPALLARAAGVELPLCAAVADLLAGRLELGGAIAALLARPLRDE